MKNNVQTKMSVIDKSRKLSNFEYKTTSIKTVKSDGNSHKFIIRDVSYLYLFSVTLTLFEVLPEYSSQRSRLCAVGGEVSSAGLATIERIY
ncbi:MAG: hypothetical protein EOO07_21175 [Chitinophagaceae bacterium]|nr:MAG: hypothetical protein EOO07_21175 [Chitinophagaceae bacterium]